MEISEVYRLANWFKTHFPELRKHYTQLHNVLTSNAAQQAQQPIEDQLNELLTFLHGMHVEELSLQQLHVLQMIDVGNLIGHDGADTVAAIVKTATYDPATVEQNVSRNLSKLNRASQLLEAFTSSVNELHLGPDEFEDSEEYITIRVGFRREASIENIADWKSSADEWYQIIRGLGLALNEPPEATKVVGATKGSLIMILAATVSLTKLLAVISKHITGIAKDVISVKLAMENLRQQNMLTKKMEAEFQILVAEKREQGLASIEADIAAMFPEMLDGEKHSALSKSVEKLLKFGEQGGDVDFVAPSEEAANDPGNHPAPGGAPQVAADIAAVRSAILDYQSEREALKQLEFDAGAQTRG
jgi:hypothetical protein